jgi:hypothetical protein
MQMSASEEQTYIMVRSVESRDDQLLTSSHTSVCLFGHDVSPDQA